MKPKKISQASLKKLVQEKNLEVTRKKPVRKPKKQEPEKPIIKQDPTSGVVLKTAEVVVDMAQSLAASADKMSESNMLVAQIAQAIQKDLNKTPAPAIVETPKKRKWKFTPVRNHDQIIQHTIVEEL